MTNIRFGLRMLLKTPIVTGVAALSLALGLGSNAAIFSLYTELLLRPLPVFEPDRLVNLEAPGPKPGSSSCDNAGACDAVFSYPMFRDLQREQTAFTGIAAHRAFAANLTHRSQNISVRGTFVSGSYFPTLGLTPATGRLLGPEDDASSGGRPVAVVSHDFWQSDLGGSADVVGQVITVNGQVLTVVGVGPAGFRGTTINFRSEIFVPITMRARLSADGPAGEGFEDRRAYWTYLFARLKSDISVEQARAEITPLYRSILSEVEAPLQAELTGRTLEQFIAKPLVVSDGRRGQSRMHDNPNIRTALLLLFGVTAAVILIACANIANMMLARSVDRAPEMAVRLSLGASRRHLLAQLLTESCLLALLGGAAGLLVAQWTLRLIGTLVPPEVANIITLALDPLAVPFIVTISLGSSVVFGVLPALHAARSARISSTKADSCQPAGARSAALFRNVLVAAEFALATVLLVASGLLLQSLRNVSNVDVGFRTENIVTFYLAPHRSGYGEQSRVVFNRIANELAAQPGVVSVTANSIPVLEGYGFSDRVMVEGSEARPDGNRDAQIGLIRTDYFRTFEIPVLTGRVFSESDILEAPKVAVVNQAFARKFNLGRDAVGTRVGRGDVDVELDTEIVGVVADTRNSVKNATPPPVLYLPHEQEGEVGGLWFYVRSTLAAEGLFRAIPAIVADVAPNVPVTGSMTLQEMARLNGFQDQALGVLSLAFAGLAALLAAIGLYGVLAYTVAQRTREFGLRMALGAEARRVQGIILKHVVRIVLAGGGIGLLGAMWVWRVAESLLYEIHGMPVAVLCVASVGLSTVAVAAGLVPAYRAARISPMAALRHG